MQIITGDDVAPLINDELVAIIFDDKFTSNSILNIADNLIIKQLNIVNYNCDNKIQEQIVIKLADVSEVINFNNSLIDINNVKINKKINKYTIDFRNRNLPLIGRGLCANELHYYKYSSANEANKGYFKYVEYSVIASSKYFIKSNICEDEIIADQELHLVKCPLVFIKKVKCKELHAKNSNCRIANIMCEKLYNEQSNINNF